MSENKRLVFIAIAFASVIILAAAFSISLICFQTFEDTSDINTSYPSDVYTTASNEATPDVEGEVSITEADFLKASGKLVLNSKNEQVMLRGTNIGGCFVRELWMLPIRKTSNVRDESGIYRTLKSRFGNVKMQELAKAWQDSFFTEKDFDNIADMGANCIRIPVWYRDFVDENGDFYDDPFEKLDWFVEEAGKRGIYVIIDMHGAPGSQNGSAHSGSQSDDPEKGSEFFFGDEAEKHQELYLEIWKEIAAHYAGNPIIAGYDLLNEPFSGYRYTTSLSENELHIILWKLYDRAYDAIRSVDEDHIVIFEAVWGTSDLPAPKRMGWENVMYEYHNYQWSDYDNAEGKQTESLKKKIDQILKSNYNVPSYMGEFTLFSNEQAWDEGLKYLNEAGIHWTTWTYKTAYGNGNWSLYHIDSNIGELVLDTASEKDILAFFEKVRESYPNKELIDVVSKHMKQ